MAYVAVKEPHYTYSANVLRVVDGDTLDLMVDLGFRTFSKIRVRLHGLNTPETFGVKKESEEYRLGKAATEFVEGWVKSAGADVLIRSHDGKPLGQGKYGRWLVEVWPVGAGGSLNEELLRLNHAEAVEY